MIGSILFVSQLWYVHSLTPRRNEPPFWNSCKVSRFFFKWSQREWSSFEISFCFNALRVIFRNCNEAMNMKCWETRYEGLSLNFRFCIILKFPGLHRQPAALINLTGWKSLHFSKNKLFFKFIDFETLCVRIQNGSRCAIFYTWSITCIFRKSTAHTGTGQTWSGNYHQ